MGIEGEMQRNDEVQRQQWTQRKKNKQLHAVNEREPMEKQLQIWFADVSKVSVFKQFVCKLCKHNPDFMTGPEVM